MAMNTLTKKQATAMLLEVLKIKVLVAKMIELDALINENTNTVKELMESKLLDEVDLGEYVVRWAALAVSRFDVTAFKQEHEELYVQYLKPSVSKRFSIK